MLSFKDFLQKLKPPIEDFRTIGRAISGRLKPPVEDIRTISSSVKKPLLTKFKPVLTKFKPVLKFSDFVKESPISYISKRKVFKPIFKPVEEFGTKALLSLPNKARKALDIARKPEYKEVKSMILKKYSLSSEASKLWDEAEFEMKENPNMPAGLHYQNISILEDILPEKIVKKIPDKIWRKMPFRYKSLIEIYDSKPEVILHELGHQLWQEGVLKGKGQSSKKFQEFNSDWEKLKPYYVSLQDTDEGISRFYGGGKVDPEILASERFATLFEDAAMLGGINKIPQPFRKYLYPFFGKGKLEEKKKSFIKKYPTPVSYFKKEIKPALPYLPEATAETIAGRKWMPPKIRKPVTKAFEFLKPKTKEEALKSGLFPLGKGMYFDPFYAASPLKRVGRIAKKAIVKSIPKELEPLAKEARKYKSAEEFVKAHTFYRGQDYEGELGSFFTPDRKFASQFGKKVYKVYISPTDIYKPSVLPKATDMGISKGIDEAKRKGFKAFFVDENKVAGTPPGKISLYVFDKSAFKTKPQLKSFYNQAIKPAKQAKPLVKKLPPVEKIKEPVQEISPVKKVIQAIKKAKPLRGEQARIYTEERGKRFIKALEIGKKVRGEKGFYAELGQLKGRIKKVQFEEIKSKIKQEDIDSLFNAIKDSPSLDYLETFPARQGLNKLLNGQVPTEGEIRLLRNVFGEDFANALLKKRGLLDKLKEAGYQLANLPRSLMASFDLSAPLRQGIFLIGKPKKFISAFKSQLKTFASEKAYKALNEEIASRPTYKLMKRNKLALTELTQTLGQREEIFMSNWAERIPIAGRVVRASGRAYTGFLNKLRADVFDDFVRQGKALGIKDPKFLKDAASFVNHATGRGSLGQLERAAVSLNSIFFSPRLMMSRLRLLNPTYYVKLHPKVRKEALKSLFTFAGAAITIASLAKMGGAEVETDPRNANFAKIKIGNTRFDILGGFQQPIRLAAQLISGKIISSTTGKTITLGEGYKPLSRFDIALRFLEYKTSPVASFALALAKGKTAIGEKVDVPTEVVRRFVPMVVQDIYELFQEEGAKGILAGTPAIFGVGVQTYGGVQSYGLKGSEYPELNKELNRLKTSIGFPSTQAFGVELSNEEYKELKEKSGRMIAEILTDIIADEDYQKLPDFKKVQLIEKITDKVKKRTKEELFPDKKIINELKKRLVKRGMDEIEAEELAKKIYKSEFSR